MNYAINEGLTGNFAWLNRRPLFASISGGKDSTALGLWLKDNGIKFTPVFIDTGWEHQATYDYIKDVLTPLFGEFITLRNEKYFKDDDEYKGGFEQLAKYNKMFPSGRVRFCTIQLKVIPIQNFYSEVRAKTKLKPICAIGIRAQESQARAKKPMIEEQDEATIFHPLIKFKDDEIVDLHHKHNTPPNPLYLKGSHRVGCYPCIYARKSEIRHLAYNDSKRIDRIRELEEKINEIRRDDQKPSTFFHKRDLEQSYIDEVVHWAKARTGRAYDDSEEIELDGCLRWGLCEPVQKSLF
jgi:3'-phosphoadenosine 5'-phosphosulfate sulfotransferase (PAPS reductase)/FAD synthetase